MGAVLIGARTDKLKIQNYTGTGERGKATNPIMPERGEGEEGLTCYASRAFYTCTTTITSPGLGLVPPKIHTCGLAWLTC